MQVLNIHEVGDVRLDPRDPPKAGDKDVVVKVRARGITTAVGYPTEMPEVVSSLLRLKEQAASLISHRYKFEDVIEALGAAGKPQSAKVMIDF